MSDGSKDEITGQQLTKRVVYHKDAIPAITVEDWVDSGNYSDPTPHMLQDPLWNAIWEEIKHWDINVPSRYNGYMNAIGNHATAIYKAVNAIIPPVPPPAESPAPPVREPEVCVDCRDYEANIRGWVRTLGGDAEKTHISAEMEERIESNVSEVERLREALRHEWWCHHGCQGIPYGDDGEMQCCGIDFKRAMFEKLRETVALLRMQAAIAGRRRPEGVLDDGK